MPGLGYMMETWAEKYSPVLTGWYHFETLLMTLVSLMLSEIFILGNLLVSKKQKPSQFKLCKKGKFLIKYVVISSNLSEALRISGRTGGGITYVVGIWQHSVALSPLALHIGNIFPPSFEVRFSLLNLKSQNKTKITLKLSSLSLFHSKRHLIWESF